MRILWVENHAVFRNLAGRQFLSDHEIQSVPDVAQAKKLLMHQVFDVVLIDYDLDDGKGTQVVDFLMALATRPKVIAVSAHAQGNQLLLDAGADAQCPKMQFATIEKVLSQLFPR